MSGKLTDIGCPTPWTYDYHKASRSSIVRDKNNKEIFCIYNQPSIELAEEIVNAINHKNAADVFLSIAEDALKPFVACNNRNPSPPREAAE